MEFLVVNSNKLKIMMNKDDMLRYGIDPNDADYDNNKTRSAFWRVLDTACAECGFSVNGDKLLIQFYPSGDGSELFVTKLGRIGSAAERSIARSQNVAMLTSRNAVYRFLGIEELIKLSRTLSEEAKGAKSNLYFSDDGAFYLTVEERGAYGALGELERIGEFGASLPYTIEPYIIEHSNKISQDGNALFLLSEL